MLGCSPLWTMTEPHRWTTAMDLKKQTSFVVFVIFYLNCVTGLHTPRDDRVKVDMSDDEVMIHWKPPEDAPSNAKYNVHMARHAGQWSEVKRCTNITETYCDLTGLITEYRTKYKVKVQLAAGDNVLGSNRFCLIDTKLQPPSFNLLATSSTLSVAVHEKPVLKEIFLFGVQYTITLEETGGDNKTTTAYLDDDAIQGDAATKVFTSLRWGQEYCVSVRVQGKGGVSSSKPSPRRCLVLPEREWYIIATSSLSILILLTLIIIAAAILLCYLKRPEKTPGALESPVSSWLPFAAREDTMEVVTDKGWFLSAYKPGVKDLVTRVTATEDVAEQERKTSTDSGISIESESAKTDGGSPPMKQEDSGCGSLGGFQGSTGSQMEYPMEDERTLTDSVKKRGYSRVGLGCQLDSSSTTLDGLDCGPLGESVPNYHSQSPSAVVVVDDEGDFERTLQDAVLADVVTGYRAGPQSCICSGLGQCSWCHKQGQYGSEVIKQYRRFVDSGLAYPSYRKTQMDAVDDLDRTFLQLGENFPLLTALSPFRLDEEEQDFNMNHVSLSLCDVHLTTD